MCFYELLGELNLACIRLGCTYCVKRRGMFQLFEIWFHWLLDSNLYDLLFCLAWIFGGVRLFNANCANCYFFKASVHVFYKFQHGKQDIIS